MDDYFRMTLLFSMKNRSKLFSIFQVFRTLIKTQSNQKICILRFDNTKEYIPSSFISSLSSKDIIHQTSCAYIPQKNGVAE